MNRVTATFSIPDWIAEGLKNQAYERHGGVIRDAKTKSIVAMLREVNPHVSQFSSLLFQFSSVSSILTLAISTLGFALIIKHLKTNECQLNSLQKDIKDLNRKFDISVYANFCAALDLARDALTMNKTEIRINMANLAINRFLEAQHIFNSYFDIALDENIQMAENYLYSLFLAYVARSRCYLELEEIDTAKFCLKEGADLLYENSGKYIYRMLYFLDEEKRNYLYRKYLNFFPPAIITPHPINVVPMIANTFLSLTPLGLISAISKENGKQESEPKFPKSLESIETVIENYCRFEAYQKELEIISKLKISSYDWLNLKPSKDPDISDAEIIYIIID